MLLRTWDADYNIIRDKHSPMVEKVWDFDSAKKMASVLVKTANGFRLYNKARVLTAYFQQLAVSCASQQEHHCA